MALATDTGEDMLPEDTVAQEQRALDYKILCDSIKRMREKAVTGRAESGIEDIWIEDQEFYDGIDDANREEKASKPSNNQAGLRTGAEEKKKTANRSSVFVEITRPYVDAAAARVADMLLPTDDRNWAIVPTPVPDLIEKLKDMTGVNGPDGQPMMQEVPPEDGESEGALPPQGPPLVPGGDQVLPNQGPVMKPVTIADKAREVIDAAKKSAEKAQTRIDDWLTECLFLDECRLVIDDSARLGVGILKGPTPKKMRKKAVIKALEGIGLVIKEEIVPWSKQINPWNFYPDPDCGEDIQNGKFCFEEDEITGRALGDLKGVPGYLDDVIDQILSEGPSDKKDGSTNKGVQRSRNDAELYKIWYFHGYLSAEDLDTLGESHGSGEQFPVIATIVNDRIIKAALSPLDSGEFPYDVFVWQRRPGQWAGKSVGRQMRTEQRGVNAATRCLMDNMGQSSRPHKAINRGVLSPGPDPWTWYTNEDSDIEDIRKAMYFFVVPSMQVELMNVIQFWMQRAEDATGMPLLLQGQQGKAPDTVGGMQILNNNASTVLRRIAKSYDAKITERHIGRYYEWVLIHGLDDSEKGDFTIKARGSSALIERDMQSQVLMQSVNLSLNPRFKLDPAKIMAKFLKSQRLDVTDLALDEAEAAKLAQVQPAPQVQAAQIREEGATQRQQAELQAEEHSKDLDRALKQWETQVNATLEAHRLDGDRGMTMDQIKAELAQTSAKLRTTISLANQRAPANMLPHPSIEPPQQAQPGFSYQQ